MNSTNAKRVEQPVTEQPRLSVYTTFAKPHDAQAERKRLRDFGLVMALAAVIVAGIFLYKGKAGHATWSAIVASFFLIPALGAPYLLFTLEKYWMKLAEKMSVVMTFLIVAITFFMVLTPIALIGRLAGKRFLQLGFDPSLKTYWEPSDSKGSGSRHYLPY